MNPLYPQSWFYNPEVFNEQAYYQYLEGQRQAYEQSQNVEIFNATKAFDNLFNALSKIDVAHQPQLMNSCMAVLVKHGITWGHR